jgi:chemotaxis protein histidine kinase CheA
MSTVCITGHGDQALAHAASLLRKAGMAQALPTEHGRAITIEQWHEQMLARAGDNAIDLQSPGRMWEKLAADLLVANLDSHCWGWASALSLRLLGFWSSFDPQMRFVLVCEPLHHMVAKHLYEGRSTKDLPALLTQWHQSHETMLRFHLRHQQKSVMVWGHTLDSHGQEHLEHWMTAWQLRLNPVQELHDLADQKASTDPNNVLLSYLAQRLVDQFPSSVALSEELAASVWTSDSSELQKHSSQPDVESLVSALQSIQTEAIALAVRNEQELAEVQLKQRINEAQQQANDEQALRQQSFDQLYAQQLQATEISQKQLEQLTKDLEATTAARDAELWAKQNLQAEREQLVSEKTKSDSTLKEANEENELLLAQLHHVQEELERQFLSCQDLKEALETQTKTAAALTSERDVLNQDKATLSKASETELNAKQALQAEREQLATDLAATAAARDAELNAKQALQAEREQLAIHLAATAAARDAELNAKQTLQAEREQLAIDLAATAASRDAELNAKQTLQAEREQLAIDLAATAAARDAELNSKQTLQAEREQLALDLAATAAARDAELNAKQTLQDERDQLFKEKMKIDSALKEANEENELLLAQLHHVQEELERQFLDNQANKLKLSQVKASNKRVMASFPGAFDCESLQLIAGGDLNTPWRWRANHLVVAGHQVDQLEFETHIEQGVTGIALERGEGQTASMLRWPLVAIGSKKTILMPLHKEQDGVNFVAVLAQLSTSDWDMTQGLHQMMVRELSQGKPDVPTAEQTAFLQTTAKTRELMRQLQDLMRFDAVTLLGHQANNNREVLSFKLTQLSFRSVRLMDFNFQLQAQPKFSDVEGSSLGGTVHLIVGRDTAGAPFDPWFSNANDSSGLPVMAITLYEYGPMPDVWERLSVVDKAFASALINALPLALALLNINGRKLPRPMKDWIELVKKMRQWMRVTPAQVTTKPALPAANKEKPAPSKRQHKPALSLAPVTPPPAPQAPAAKKTPAAKKQTKVAAVVKPAAKKPAARPSARPPVSARASK